MNLDSETPLFRQGQPTKEVFLVLRGSVHCFAEYGHLRSLVDIVEFGGLVGDATCLPGPHTVTAMGQARSCLLAVDAEWLAPRIQCDFSLTTAALASAAARLRRHVGELADLKMKTAEQRFGSFLLSLCRAHSGVASVVLPFDKKILADKLGMTAPTLSRAQAKLRRIGVMRGANTALYEISDVALLRRFCHALDL